MSNMYPWVDTTWNPAAGRCRHGCQYCLGKGTKVLMKNFEEKPIEEIEQGDKIIGISQREKSNYREYVIGEVLDISKRKAKTLKIKTDKDEIISTREHPFLGGSSLRNGRDWINARNLTPYYILRYIGRGINSKDYLKGWLSGYTEGDGCFFDYGNQYSGDDKPYRGFEAVSIDSSIRDFLIKTAESFDINLASGEKHSTKKSFGNGKILPMVFSRKTEQVRRFEKIAEFKYNQSKDFYAGYLGGIFDADGSIDNCGNMRIANTDSEVRKHIFHSVERLSINIVEEDGISFRLGGGMRTKLKLVRFSNCLRKRKSLLLGRTITNTPIDEIKSIKKTGRKVVYNLKTTCGNYIANGFIVHNCYMKDLSKRFSQVREKYSGEPRIDESELGSLGGNGKTIFVCSATDLFGDWVPSSMILRILDECREYSKNTYLFQTKNPWRFWEFLAHFPKNSIFGTTIESNRAYENISEAPWVREREYWVAASWLEEKDKMVSIEPILKFDLELLVEMMERIDPEFVSIGADSKGGNLPEPRWEKVEKLVERLREFTEVKEKGNLSRLK